MTKPNVQVTEYHRIEDFDVEENIFIIDVCSLGFNLLEKLQGSGKNVHIITPRSEPYTSGYTRFLPLIKALECSDHPRTCFVFFNMYGDAAVRDLPADLPEGVRLVNGWHATLAECQYRSKFHTISYGLNRYARRSAVGIDVGGFHGWIADLMQRKAGCVHIFEPMPDNFDYLEDRYQSVSTVTVQNLACDDAQGKARFNLSVNPQAGSLTDINTASGDVIEVQRTTLDAYVKDHGLTDVGVIKVDAETRDLNVVDGAREVISLNRPTIIIEVGGGTFRPVAEYAQRFCDEFGYRAIRASDDIDAIAYWTHCEYTETFEEFVGISSGRVIATDLFLVPAERV